jgi:hypothetical protein
VGVHDFTHGLPERNIMNTYPSALLHRIAIGALAASAGSAIVLLGPAGSAVAPATSTVTIQADGTDLSGTVMSPRTACKDGRKVIVIKQIGTRGGGDDIRFASDTAELQDGIGVWSTGNTGTPGRFYAKVKKTDLCKRDTSPTIRATR